MSAVGRELFSLSHGEAGDQIVFELFGLELRQLVLAGAQMIVEWSRSESSLEELRREFKVVNVETPGVGLSDKIPIQMTANRSNPTVIQFRGVCGLSGR